MSIFAGYSISLNTQIVNISGGEYEFGFGMFPLGTVFAFDKDFQMIPGYKHNAYFKTQMSFYLVNSKFEGYEYDTGKPEWNMKAYEKNKEKLISGEYFHPSSNIDVFLQQYIGTNPVSKSGRLGAVRLGLNSNFAIARESLGVSRGNDTTIFIDPSTGKFKHPFGPGSVIPAYPWLQDSRNSLNNYVYLLTYFDFNQSSAFDTWDGAYAEIELEYGPSWLANTVAQDKSSSNYFKPEIYAEQRLTLYNSTQKNGWNWINMYIGHSNTLRYIFGDIIPENRMPTDRLRGLFNDRIWLRFTGPQFLAGDCYPYIDITLNNNIYFGKVANEISNTVSAVEYKSSVSMTFHIRVFGFIHFQYRCGYDMSNGIWADNPGWWQDAALSFYVSL